MTATLTSALAPTFLWTSPGVCISVKVPTGGGGVQYNATLSTTWARILLGKGATINAAGTETLPDFLQALQAAINTACAASGKTFTVGMSATGKLTLTYDDAGGAFDLVSIHATLDAIVGTWAPAVNTQSITATYQPRHVAFMASVVGGDFSPRTPGAYARTAGGRSYGVSSGVTTYVRRITLDWIPGDPSIASATGENTTPERATQANMPSASINNHSGQWSWVDVLAQARGAGCGLAIGNLQALRTDTAQRYYVGGLAAEVLTSPDFPQQDESRDAYRSLAIEFATFNDYPTNTRA